MFTSKHRPAGTDHHFDNERITELIGRYQTLGDPEALAGIITRAQERAKILIRFNRTARYLSEDELLSDVNWKLLRVVDKFDPSKGSAFTFLSQAISTSLCTSVSNARKSANRYSELDENITNTLITEAQDTAAADELTYKIRAGVKTMLSNERELSTQRCYVDSFTEEGFEARRHQCANAAMAVYGLSHARSRELYDLTMLEVRRVLYDDIKPKQEIAAGRLIRTRCAWMVRYQSLMSEPEFTKFVILMRDLAPYLLLLIDPANHNRRRDRSPQITRRNLKLILDGSPDAVPLFESSISDLS